MKVYILTFVLLLIASAGFCQKNIEGNWLGTLDAGVKIRIVFHIIKNSDGTYSGTLDSPDQNAKGIKATSVTTKGDSVFVAIDMIKGGFAGHFINDTTVTGNWSQGPGMLPLTIVKTDKDVTINRPQTPKPPFAYKAEEVEYGNDDNTVHLAGTLTYPNGKGPFPAAILISGSGQQDRDETIFNHKMFAVLADHLTKQGFAILRVDDRGMGKSTGDLEHATSADFASDVEMSLTYLQTRPEIDGKKTGLIGHSEGGLIASLVASRRKDIDFIVLLAGPGTKGNNLMADQNEAVMKNAGYTDGAISVYQPFYLQVLNTSVGEKDTTAAFNKVWASYKNWKQNTSQAYRNQLGFSDDAMAEKILHTMVNQVSMPWYKYFLTSDPAKLLAATNTKVLALNGEKDIQVLAKPNLAGIKAALANSKNVVETRELAGLNHLFQTCKKCTVNEYAELEETISPVALNAISDWLVKNVK